MNLSPPNQSHLTGRTRRGSKTHTNSNFISGRTSHTCTDEIMPIGASCIANVVCSEIWRWVEEDLNTLAAKYALNPSLFQFDYKYI